MLKLTPSEATSSTPHAKVKAWAQGTEPAWDDYPDLEFDSISTDAEGRVTISGEWYTAHWRRLFKKHGFTLANLVDDPASFWHAFRVVNASELAQLVHEDWEVAVPEALQPVHDYLQGALGL